MSATFALTSVASATAATAATATAATSVAVSSMTRHEVDVALKKAEANYAAVVETLDRYGHMYHRYTSSAEKHALKAHIMREKNPEDPRIADKLAASNRLIRQSQHIQDCIPLATEERDRLYHRMEQLRAQTLTGSTASTASSSGEVQLLVRLLSGDIMTVNVDALLPVARFADFFAEQNHYAPSATLRMAFLFLNDSDESKDAADATDATDALDIFWAPEKRHEGKTVGDMLLGRPDTILNLIIRPLEDAEKTAKMDLIRKILHTAGLHNNFSNDELFGMYSNWLLTWIPPAKTNRYIRMRSFVDAHPDVFISLTPVEKEEQTLRLDVERFKEFRDNQAKFTIFASFADLQRQRQVYDITSIAHIQGWARDRPHESMSVTLLDALLRRFTVPELLEAGVTREMVPPTHKHYGFIVNWDRYVAYIALSDATAAAAASASASAAVTTAATQ